jgi:hypothetical protein
MRRRKFLVTTGAIVPIVSGCLFNADDSNTTSNQSTDTETRQNHGPDNNTGSSTESAIPEKTETEGGNEHPLSDFHTKNVGYVDEYPDYSKYTTFHIKRIVASDHPESSEAPIYLQRSRESISKEETVTFSLSNGSDELLRTNFYGWHLDKKTNGDWHNVKLSIPNQPEHTVRPGEEQSWRINPNHDAAAELSESIDPSPGDLQPSLGEQFGNLIIPGLGGGTYAFGIIGRFGNRPRDESTAFISTFELESAPVELSPTDDLRNISKDERTVYAETDAPSADLEIDPPVVYKLARIQGRREDAIPIITEQLWRSAPIWDVFALIRQRDTEQASLTERNILRRNGAFLQLGDDQSRTGIYEYQGEYYELTVTES